MRPRLSRPCYDKAHRCPGWAGGGGRSAKQSRCDGGRIQVRRPYNAETMIEQLADGGLNTHPGAFPFKFGHCTTCNVITLPWATRYLDPTHWVDELRWKARTMRWALRDHLDRFTGGRGAVRWSRDAAARLRNLILPRK